eukprot:TRINITY_DN15293_c1_g1_i2.p1 TRINITY_DN15293_c1_g1~~TRINITY_DN15293_c1_g1_i2.p1  ORF type:complete len:565 (+),score=25.46 TRINITY_DN15293_c1_g1_i2:107-1696(+)
MEMPDRERVREPVPIDILHGVYSFLCARDAAVAQQVCTSWLDASQRAERLWSEWLFEVFGEVAEETPDVPSRQQFYHLSRKVHRPELDLSRSTLLEAYRLIQALRRVVQLRCPAVQTTFSSTGASADDLRQLRERTHGALPKEVEAFYAVMDGQLRPTRAHRAQPLLHGDQEKTISQATGFDYCPVGFGLFGGWTAYDSFSSLFLLPAAKVQVADTTTSKVALLGMSMAGNLALLGITLETEQCEGAAASVQRGQLVHIAPPGGVIGVLAADSWNGFWREHIRRLATASYQVRLGSLLLFSERSGFGGCSSATTRGITVLCSPLVMPNRSTRERVEFAYRIRFVASKDAPFGYAQVRERMWCARDRPGADFQQIVRGPGVVGHLPILFPGDSWEYASMTAVDVRDGRAWSQMQGWISFRTDTQETIHAVAGPFTFDCDPASVIEATKQDPEADRNVQSMTRGLRGLKIGGRVRIGAGPSKGVEGELEGLSEALSWMVKSDDGECVCASEAEVEPLLPVRACHVDACASN